MNTLEVVKAVDGSTLSPAERILLVMMAQATGGGPTCYAAIRGTLDRMSGLSDVTIVKCQKSLCEQGILIPMGMHRWPKRKGLPEKLTPEFAFNLAAIKEGRPESGRRGKGVRRRKSDPVDDSVDSDEDAA